MSTCMQFLNTEFAALVFDHAVLASCMAPFVLTHISAGSHCPWHIAHLERSKARLLLDLMFHLMSVLTPIHSLAALAVRLA